ncbi:uncharacterized protein FIESC28_10600 [Fusarium coffeatum]|uniref:Phospholipid scramblase n=1 Tax=Fusarium coffeatum TaxID=231269 RepID=A0A366QRI4_9HYPO|nr:uncharacterized protein FIESC28_10600 [Fusarium coffeatum]RBR07519.1 hypothetical protein FIESC28_10600 [Fusarium coffeatum]
MTTTYQVPPNGVLPPQDYQPPSKQSIYQSSENNAPAPYQDRPNGPARYKITKPSFHSRYECTPEDDTDRPATYSLQISSRKKKPDLAFSAEGAPMGECFFPEVKKTSPSDSKSFRIALGNPSNAQWTELIHHGEDNYGWTFMFNLPSTGQPMPMTWKKDNNIAVDGMHASKLGDNNFNLQDPNGQVMAVFTRQTFSLRSSAIGTLQTNVDLGPLFEYAVVMSLLCIYEYRKREENNSASSSGLGAIAAVAAAGGAGASGGGGGGGGGC